MEKKLNKLSHLIFFTVHGFLFLFFCHLSRHISKHKTCLILSLSSLLLLLCVHKYTYEKKETHMWASESDYLFNYRLCHVR